MSTPTHSQPSETAKQKRAKARVMFTYKNARGEKCVQSHKRDLDSNPWTVAIIPTATRKQAQQIVKWANLSREQKVEAIARHLARETVVPGWHNKPRIFRDDASAILNLIEGDTK